jgi:hypothetical protein
MVQMAPDSQSSLIISLIAGNSGAKARTAAVPLTMAFAVGIGFAGAASAQPKSIVAASTTSTQDSGLFGHLLPIFKARTGIDDGARALLHLLGRDHFLQDALVAHWPDVDR